MNKERHNPPTPPEWADPSHIPHYPEWPNMPYADWPRSRFHRWNDSEPANVRPWWYDHCEPMDNPCVCVTDADVDLWNSYSGLSGLTVFDASALSAAFSALDDMGDYDMLRKGYYDVSANSAMWNSAGYVPNIYDNISALYDYLNDKADYSAFSSFHVWTDSEKARVEAGAYGDYSGTMVGMGTYERPLRVSPYVIRAVAEVDLATSGYMTKLANVDAYDKLQKDIDRLNRQITSMSATIGEQNRLIEWILNNMNVEAPADLTKNLGS